MKREFGGNKMKGSMWCLVGAALFAVGCSTAPAPEQVTYTNSLVGPPGYQGPAGPVGPQGAVGPAGPHGYVMAGPAGAEGPAGPIGPQGAIGAVGPTGDVMAGGRGMTGAAGPMGAQGEVGEMGARGASMVGPMGPAGPVGPAGAQGATGYAGVKGPTLVGPVGPIGNAGIVGAQGAGGAMGAQGYATAGSAGAMGPSGDVGEQGPAGPAGAQGAAGIVGRWAAYRDFTFYGDQANLQPSDVTMTNEIASYMANNPSLQIGIDGSTNPSGAAPTNQELNDRRVSAVKTALLNAGVPAYKIQIGPFGDPQLRRDGRVEALLSTGNSSVSRLSD
jgi:outer membrane protein OmpA-like peptidoglycan-associated protein